MTINKTLFILFFAVAVLSVSLSVFSPENLGADTTRDVDNSLSEGERFYHYTLISASTTQATSTGVSIAGAEAVEIYFSRVGASTSVATSTFEIEVSPDGVNFFNYNKLISNVTNTNSQMLTRVASVEIVGASSTVSVALDLQFDTFRSLRCIATQASTTLESTDGSTCAVSVFGKI